jgi:hypothetical protein
MKMKKPVMTIMTMKLRKTIMIIVIIMTTSIESNEAKNEK